MISLAELYANLAIIGLVLATALTTTLMILSYGLLKKYKYVEKLVSKCKKIKPKKRKDG